MPMNGRIKHANLRGHDSSHQILALSRELNPAHDTNPSIDVNHPPMRAVEKLNGINHASPDGHDAGPGTSTRGVVP